MRSGVEQTCGRQRTFSELGGVGEWKHRVIRSKFIQDRLELNIAAGCEGEL